MQWNLMPQHQGKEPTALALNKRLMAILTERDAAIRERNAALSEKAEALAARDEALRQRDEAISQRDIALMERDNAIAALQIRENSANFPSSGAHRGRRRMHHPSNHLDNVNAPYREAHVMDAFPISSISSEVVEASQTKRTKTVISKIPKGQRKAKKVGEDLNRQATSEVKKYKSEWESQDLGLNIVAYDETTMPAPVCSCTGIPRQCYKWGNGGWQSSCCTTTLSMYPLPPMPNKRHARVGGRKMSGNVFTRLLSRLAAEGHDLSVPVDLKDFWARHGTNRYITIK